MQRVYPMQQTGQDLFHRTDVEDVMNWLKETKMGTQELQTELRERLLNMLNRQLRCSAGWWVHAESVTASLLVARRSDQNVGDAREIQL